MKAGRLQAFFGDDWDDAIDSVKSTPGAIGNLLVGFVRLVRPIDAVAFAAVLAGWLWLLVGYGLLDDHSVSLLLLSILPSVLWLTAGVTGGLVFEIGGIGARILAYWESYLLILLFAIFGVASLRLALSPKDRRVYHGAPPASDA